MAHARERAVYVVCVSNRDFEASLVTLRLYRALHDEKAAAQSLVRVIDESGEDYLYPASMFVVIDIPQQVEQAFDRA